MVGLSLFWNLQYIKIDGMERAYSEAKANINKDRTFRRWATEHGGVYVPITKTQGSVEWLSHVPDRDVVTLDGKKLTLLNPASMLRQIMDRYAADYGIRGRITGLKFLNPGNAPDSWEKNQLISFTAEEKKEVWEIANINGQPHLRYLRAMYMEPGCEKCHGILGYKIGDMRGATGINLPLTGYYQQIKNAEINTSFSHSAIWLLGIIGIVWSSLLIKKAETKRREEEYKRILAENKISSEKERLQVTLKSIGDGVITTDLSGNIVVMNPIAETLTGWTQSEAQGKPVEEVFKIINEFTRMPRENPVKRALQTGKVVELENHTLLLSKDGSERIIADSGAPIIDNNNNTYGVVLVFRDMTEKQKLLDSIQRTTKLESLGVLAGGIAHDFNNLLGGIFGYIDLGLNLSTDEKVSEYLTKAKSTIDRARGLTQQLLTFAMGGAPIKKVGKLKPFIKETVIFALSGSNVKCNFQIPDDLFLCEFDKNQIGQVIDNLIINALQAMPTGGTIDITANNCTIKENEHSFLQEGCYVKISIKDTGTGIPKDILSKIFDPFFTTKPKGHGLGLASSYSIINKHGGCIDVETEIGVGSIFHFALPALKDNFNFETPSENSHYSSEGNFLIMDDEEILLEIISEMLKSFGYSVVCAKNGSETISCFKDSLNSGKKFVGMIFDLTIPGAMGGLETIGEIRKYDPDIPVFVSSGYSGDPVIANPKIYGFTDSIKKPFNKSDLANLLRKNLIYKS